MHIPPTPQDEADLEAASPHAMRNRIVAALFVLLTVLIVAFIPPLINVSRFQRRVDRDISASIGRPVHFDQIRLTLLPMPGFTLENFVIDEDPAFGYEPILRSDEVRATIRIGSLWRRRVEISRISLTPSTSINLVHLANGKWNIESLLLQATRLEAAPTAQNQASQALRLPYVEATGARLNLKLDQKKTAFSLTDADFALWLPEPHQWHLRLEAHPTRTDLSPGDTGTFRVEGLLGGAPSSAAPTPATPSFAQILIDLHGDWRDAQLGDLSRLFSGADAGIRGDFSLTFSLLGTLERNAITTDIKLLNARRADFVPSHSLALELGCRADSANTFHAFSGVECHCPPAGVADHAALIVTAHLPDVRRLESTSVQITVPALPASILVDWLSVATPHPPLGLGGSGSLAGTVAWEADAKIPDSAKNWTGELELSSATLNLGDGSQPIPLDDIVLRSTPVPAVPARSRRRPAPSSNFAPDSFDLLPLQLPLGAREPATLEGRVDQTGYTLHLTGAAVRSRLLALGEAVPQLGSGLEDCLPHFPASPADPPQPVPARGGAQDSTSGAASAANAVEPLIHLNMKATRTWGGPQFWCPAALPSRPSAQTP